MRWKSCLSIRTNEAEPGTALEEKLVRNGGSKGGYYRRGWEEGPKGGGLWVGGRTEDKAQVRQDRRRDVAEACLFARRVRCWIHGRDRPCGISHASRELSQTFSCVALGKCPQYLLSLSYLYSGSWYLSNWTAEKNRWTTSQVPSPGSSTAVVQRWRPSTSPAQTQSNRPEGSQQEDPLHNQSRQSREPSWILLIIYSYFWKSLPS